eukprot:scaffold8602_cov196-Amphora_coffeaeformis.AAC.22
MVPGSIQASTEARKGLPSLRFASIRRSSRSLETLLCTIKVKNVLGGFKKCDRMTTPSCSLHPREVVSFLPEEKETRGMDDRWMDGSINHRQQPR